MGLSHSLEYSPTVVISRNRTGLPIRAKLRGPWGETGGDIGDRGRRDHVFLSFFPEVYLGVKISSVGRIRREEAHILGEAMAVRFLSEDPGVV